MKRTTLHAHHLQTIDWYDHKIIDWSTAGTQYAENTAPVQLQQYDYDLGANAAISSDNGEYVLLYQKLGTKALLLKNGELLREINRSYYHAQTYEFPAAFFTHQGKTYLIHCPVEYCQLDIEDVETGEVVTNIPTRKPHDFFHSRLEVSPDHKYLMSKGWYWHPFNSVLLFDLTQCLANPLLLDDGVTLLDVGAEICTASFVDGKHIQLGTYAESEDYEENKEDPILPGQIGTWHVETHEIAHAVKIQAPFGNIFAIDATTCWDLYEYPKIIDLRTGQIIDQNKDIFSGHQTCSIIHHIENLPMTGFNRSTKQIAIAQNNTIDILTP